MWTFAQVKDSASNTFLPSDGLTYCGSRTYTLSGNGSWLTIGTGALNNQLTLLSTVAADATSSPYTVTLTVSLPAYADVASKSTTFTITIGACVITSASFSGSIADKNYIIGDV